MQLHPAQVALLQAAWKPVAEPQFNDNGNVPVWPVWDYVERTVRKDHPDVEDVSEILQSLPTWTVGAGGMARIYRCLWWDNEIGGGPQAASTVGLTIAGLHALGPHNKFAADTANDYAAVVGAIARADDKLEPNPTAPVKGELQLASFTGGLRTATPQHVQAIPDSISAPVLQKEAALLQISRQQGEGAVLHLGGGWSRQFCDAASSKQYLDLVTQLSQEWDAQPHQSPLNLVQTLDYLGAVLAVDPNWPDKNLTDAPDLESAAALGSEVNTRDEYRAALGGLCTVLDRLKAPSVPSADRRDGQNASLARLEHWLTEHAAPHVGDERIAEAMQTLRDVRRVRNVEVHPSSEKQRDATLARPRLGMPEVVVDYRGAWSVIRERTAGALDLIRQDVQAAQRTRDE